MFCLTTKNDSDMRPHRDKIQIIVFRKHEDKYWEIPKTFPRQYHTHTSTRLLLWPLNTNKTSDKATEKTSSAMPIEPTMKQPSLNLLSDDHSSKLINYGSWRRHYTWYITALDTSLKRSPIPSKTWVSKPLLMTTVCTWSLSPMRGIQSTLAYMLIFFLI